MATMQNFIHMLDRRYMFDAEGFIIEVQVEDIKNSYGTWRARITPVHGTGTRWVSVDRLEEKPQTTTGS